MPKSLSKSSIHARAITAAVLGVDALVFCTLGLFCGGVFPGSWSVLAALSGGCAAVSLMHIGLLHRARREADPTALRITASTWREKFDDRAQRQESLVRSAESAELAAEVLHNVGNVFNTLSSVLTDLRENFDRGMVREVDRALETLQRGARESASSDLETRVGGFVAAARKQLSREKQRLHVELQQVDQLVQHVADMVAAQQMQARGTTYVRAEETDVAALVTSSVAICHQALLRADARVELQLDDVGLVTVTRSKLVQVVTNLIKNAAEAVADQPPDRRLIWVSLTPNADDYVQLRVVDLGSGIAPEQLARIFSHGFTTKLSGHGFGLSSCIRLVQELDGALTAASEGPDRGATFTLTLPRHKVARKEAEVLAR